MDRKLMLDWLASRKKEVIGIDFLNRNLINETRPLMGTVTHDKHGNPRSVEDAAHWRKRFGQLKGVLTGISVAATKDPTGVAKKADGTFTGETNQGRADRGHAVAGAHGIDVPDDNVVYKSGGRKEGVLVYDPKLPGNRRTLGPGSHIEVLPSSTDPGSLGVEKKQKFAGMATGLNRERLRMMYRVGDRQNLRSPAPGGGSVGSNQNILQELHAKSVGREISHLIKDKGFSKKRAIAASLSAFGKSRKDK